MPPLFSPKGETVSHPHWQAALREVAAYLLDHGPDGRFARVPHTALVRASHPVFHYAQTAHLVDSSAAAAGTGRAGGEAGGDVAAAAPIGPPAKLGSLQVRGSLHWLAVWGPAAANQTSP